MGGSSGPKAGIDSGIVGPNLHDQPIRNQCRGGRVGISRVDSAMDVPGSTLIGRAVDTFLGPASRCMDIDESLFCVDAVGLHTV
jgi:hypothetical protein